MLKNQDGLQILESRNGDWEMGMVYFIGSLLTLIFRCNYC